MTVAALLVAAGRGRRLGGEIPKQYIPLAGPPALTRSAQAFLALADITAVLPVIHPDDRGLADEALSSLTDPRLLPPVMGGDTRAASVRNGLDALEARGPARVLIHDAARPFVPGSVIRAVIAALDTHPGACAALPVVDALWRAEDGMAETPVPRDGLWRAQTPQGFHFAPILAAHRAHDGSGADDVAVAREAGLAVTFVEGSEASYKITTATDLARALSDLVPGG
ncbi:2-C-methyl-D-erythritol 4-phosphate cytidylyltransferase [Ovoidimarina sediminis]|uniref:2-C-methyl-D-erythritol 4-phosphate cytidylyltransferase n=1 Tax=Ovoidimarina sediminis TaxID=3079856 RepID=UPI002910BDE3|nr:2-C-methyl-D-erythritol 4-phosphate cytidylyltransferase [Rhodophyticola sp. MJ-SS7]MDU8944076.1 2-C-methyl-D-erythritol 4-phosphate cytidylyltransferase [Rhodophyticola sp. MJ-SS7]